jgi:hypothetical protein
MKKAYSSIGFNTPSKKEAEETMNQTQSSPLNVDAVKSQTMSRLGQLGNIICSNDFAGLPLEQKQAMLVDFAYYSKVADSL